MADDRTPAQKAEATRKKNQKAKEKELEELQKVKAELKAEKMKSKWFIKGFEKAREYDN